MAKRIGLFLIWGLSLVCWSDSALAATYTWANPGTSGLFSVGSNWDLGTVPTNTDSIVLPASGTPYTVTAGDVHNGIAGNVIVVDISIGNNATLETGDPVNFFANGAITMSAGARLRRTNCPSNAYLFTGSAASVYDPDSIIEMADPQTVNFWIDNTTTVGTVVINQPLKSNPVYPGPYGGGNTSFRMSGDLYIKEGRYAAGWGYNIDTIMRDFIADGGQGTGVEVRMRNGNVSGAFTVRRNLVVRNGATLRDAAGALVVGSPVVIEVGGNVTNSATITQLGGVFQWLFRFTGSGTHTWDGTGATVNAIEDLEVLGGNTLDIAGSTLNLSGSSTSAILDEVPSGGALTGTLVENALYASYGTIRLGASGVGLNVTGSANVDVGGRVPVELASFELM